LRLLITPSRVEFVSVVILPDKGIVPRWEGSMITFDQLALLVEKLTGKPKSFQRSLAAF